MSVAALFHMPPAPAAKLFSSVGAINISLLAE
jgi:hypothetical protein